MTRVYKDAKMAGIPVVLVSGIANDNQTARVGGSDPHAVEQATIVCHQSFEYLDVRARFLKWKRIGCVAHRTKVALFVNKQGDKE